MEFDRIAPCSSSSAKISGVQSLAAEFNVAYELGAGLECERFLGCLRGGPRLGFAPCASRYRMASSLLRETTYLSMVSILYSVWQ